MNAAAPVTPPPILAYMRHIREANLCSSGMRAWFTLHGFDVLDFIRHGIDVTRLEATGDLFALKVAAIARAEAGKQGSTAAEVHG